MTSVSSTAKTWQGDNTKQFDPVRKMNVQRVMEILRLRAGSANEDFKDKIPKIATKLEAALFYQAKDFNEYNNPDTIRSRLRGLAETMITKMDEQPKDV